MNLALVIDLGLAIIDELSENLSCRTVIGSLLLSLNELLLE